MKLKVALFILYDEKMRFLLQHRTIEAERLPGYWAFFGGSIEDGETPLEAVHRESFEELGYHLKAPELVFEQDFILENAEGHMLIYIDAFKNDESELKLHEGQDLGWYTLEEMKNLKMVEHDRRVVEKAAQYLELRKQKEVLLKNKK